MPSAPHRYHADRVGSEGYERDQCGQPAGGPQETAARSAEAAGLPGEAELMDGEPDEQVVEPAENLPAGAKCEQVDERGGGGRRAEGSETEALPGPVGEGDEHDHEDVDDEEPGGQEGELGGHLDHPGVDVGAGEPEAGNAG